MTGVEDFSVHAKTDELPGYEEFDPFMGLENNIICTSCKFGADPILERDMIIAHYNSQWHRVNVKRISQGKRAFSEEELEEAIEAEDSVESSDDEDAYNFSLENGSLAFFVQKQTVYSIYRSILVNGEKQPNQQVFMRPLNCAIFLLAGGHFSGAVFMDGKMTLHKTMHRYVIRAKQGKAQSNMDGKGVASSAGSSLRRYNERTLKNEISDILLSWKEDLAKVPLVFIRCASFQKSTFQVAGILEKGDHRIRSIPFATKRPSLAELKNAWERLQHVGEHGPINVFCETLDALRRKNISRKNLQKKKKEDIIGIDDNLDSSKTSSEVRKLDHLKTSKSETQKEDLWPDIHRSLRSKLYHCVAEKDEDNFIYILDKADNRDQIIKYIKEARLIPKDFTFLHFAASLGCDNIVEYLLSIGCDPSDQDDEGRVPYALSASKNTKNIFINFRARNPTAWPYGKTHIPVIHELTEEQKAKQDEKKRDKKQRQREKLKQKKFQAKEEAEELQAKVAFLNLSEREKRAMAAEARLGTISRCVNCGNMLPKIPFEYNDVKLCSPACVAAHRSRFSVTPTNA